MTPADGTNLDDRDAAAVRRMPVLLLSTLLPSTAREDPKGICEGCGSGGKDALVHISGKRYGQGGSKGDLWHGRMTVFIPSP